MATSDTTKLSLRELFTPVVARVLFFTKSDSTAPDSFGDVRREITALLEEARTLQRRHEIPTQEFESAQFAIVAWLDEMLSNPKFGVKPEICSQWRRSPLQAEKYQTTKAGEDFYKRMDQLQPSQKDVYEIYHLCLCLGFRGQYYDEEQDYKLHEVKKTGARHLPVTFPEFLDLEKTNERLTPQPYEVPTPLEKPRPRPVSPKWLWVPLLGVLALLLYLLWPTGPSRDAVENALKRFECHSMKVSDINEGTVRLTGRVQDQDQRQQVHQAVHQVAGVIGVEDTFTFLPYPFCDVVALLTPFEQRATVREYGLSVRPQNGCDAIYRNGDKLVVNVAAAKPLRHVYVDYYVADKKKVAHLLPNTKESEDPSHETTMVTIGDDQSLLQWHIQEPFGMELVTVISSPTPLFTTLHTAPEQARSYIDTLRRSLPTNPNTAEVGAAYCFITSREQ